FREDARSQEPLIISNGIRVQSLKQRQNSQGSLWPSPRREYPGHTDSQIHHAFKNVETRQAA
ncbi:MAG: hypothetical protein ACLP9L_19295, partial [Thermoguttaceae bacterium]